jgi:hypothetical protein
MRRLRETVDRAVLAAADGRLPASSDVTTLNRAAAEAPRPTPHIAITDGRPEPAGITSIATDAARSRTGSDRPGRRRSAPVRRDPARTRLRRGHVRTALPRPLPRPQPPLMLHVPLRQPHQGPPPPGPGHTEWAHPGRLSHHELLAQPRSAHSAGLIRNAGPGTLSMSSACTAWPRSQRIWASTCAPHPRCRASTAGPSGSAR